MSNTTLSGYPSARGGDRPARRPQPQPEAEYEEYDEYEDEYPEYDEYDESADDESVGLFSSPARTVAVVGSMLILLVIGVAVAWKLGDMSKAPAANSGFSAQTGQVGPKTGLLAPGFNLVDVKTNRAISLASMRGKPVWLNFWGTWCPPCKAEMPEIEKLYQQYKGQIDIVGISMGPRDEPAGVAQFVDLNSYHWQFIHDADSSVMNNYQVTGIPSSFFIDKNGVIRAIHVGGAQAAELEANLKLALNAQ